MRPFEKAKHILQLSSAPEYLPCREDEFQEIEAYLEDAIDEGNGMCLCKRLFASRAGLLNFSTDIAGVPGTGKTATVMRAIQVLNGRVREGVSDELDAF
jgi:origin recognition complex subunit 1